MTVSRDEMATASRTESFSLVLAEAMQSGVVPIAYESDGPSFILESFPDQLVTMSEIDALTKRLVDCAGAQDLEHVREELLRSIEERFSPGVIARQWQELLDLPTPC